MFDCILTKIFGLAEGMIWSSESLVLVSCLAFISLRTESSRASSRSAFNSSPMSRTENTIIDFYTSAILYLYDL